MDRYIPEDRRFDFCTKETCIMRAKFIFVEFNKEDIFEQEVEKALESDKCTICGYQTYDKTNRCDKHKNAKLTEFWPKKDSVIPERVYNSIKRKFDEL